MITRRSLLKMLFAGVAAGTVTPELLDEATSKLAPYPPEAILTTEMIANADLVLSTEMIDFITRQALYIIGEHILLARRLHRAYEEQRMGDTITRIPIPDKYVM